MTQNAENAFVATARKYQKLRTITSKDVVKSGINHIAIERRVRFFLTIQVALQEALEWRNCLTSCVCAVHIYA